MAPLGRHQQLRAQVARLGHHARPSGLRPQQGEARGVQFVMRGDDTHAVWAHQHHAVALGGADHPVLESPPFRPGLGEPRRHHHGRTDALAPALADDRVHQRCPHRHHGQVRSFRQFRHARMDRQPQDGASFGVHQIQRAGKAAQPQVGHQHAAPLVGVRRRTDHHDAPWRHQGIQAGKVRGRPGGDLHRFGDRDESIDRHRPGAVEQQRIDVYLPDLRVVLPHLRHGLDDTGQGRPVHGWTTPEGAQKDLACDGIEEFLGVLG